MILTVYYNKYILYNTLFPFVTSRFPRKNNIRNNSLFWGHGRENIFAYGSNISVSYLYVLGLSFRLRYFIRKNFLVLHNIEFCRRYWSQCITKGFLSMVITREKLHVILFSCRIQKSKFWEYTTIWPKVGSYK